MAIVSHTEVAAQLQDVLDEARSNARWYETATPKFAMTAPPERHAEPKHQDELSAFLEEVRSSCTGFAERKGYLDGDVNILSEITRLLDVEQGQIIGEIIAKVVEFRKSPKRLLAVKIAGWASRLWLTAKE